ncbi:SH3 domain-containing protein [Sphingomonas sp. R647]|uniref:SH3 domain-containing protein n=1 Tax=Sphingomonas sp. R647 TaxID=2875233 RepID=UPI001CD2939B|nr:SH3 domain-containing protein [Sphingomonas sp. R647]MCA1200133.1 SH3 domain-containing protein [Sphingomonas sp. R647]
MRFTVTAHGLFLRKEPRQEAGNERAVLPEGCTVEVHAREGKWCRVTGTLDGVSFEGWVSGKYLAKSEDVIFATASQLAPVHWRANNPGSTRAGPASASPIGESGMPRNAPVSRAGLDKVIDWLDVENSRRYRPGGGRTYCNIYAYDVAYASSVFLPRVWWTDKAIAALEAGQQVAAQYDVTIREMNANAIHNWLLDYGVRFGWKRTLSLTELQECANRGGIATICARRKDLARSGHIVIVAPETAQKKARRDANGRVTMPVQSQAGSVNFERSVPASAWWADARFSSFVLFIHD